VRTQRALRKEFDRKKPHSKLVCEDRRTQQSARCVSFSKKTSGFWCIPALFLVDNALFYGISSSKCLGMSQKSEAEYAPPFYHDNARNPHPQHLYFGEGQGILKKQCRKSALLTKNDAEIHQNKDAQIRVLRKQAICGVTSRQKPAEGVASSKILAADPFTKN